MNRDHAEHASRPRRGDKITPSGNELEVHVPPPLDIDGQLIGGNVRVAGRRTSLRLEAVMWNALHTAAARENMDIHELVTLVSELQNANASLTATIRAFLIAYFIHLSRATSEPILARMLPEILQGRQTHQASR